MGMRSMKIQNMRGRNGVSCVEFKLLVSIE